MPMYLLGNNMQSNVMPLNSSQLLSAQPSVQHQAQLINSNLSQQVHVQTSNHHSSYGGNRNRKSNNKNNKGKL